MTLNYGPRMVAGVALLGMICASGLFAAQNKATSLNAETTRPIGGGSAKTGTAAAPKSSPVLTPDSNAYRIGVEDSLQIDVWKEPELSMGVTVRPDGMITLPLVNDIHAAGLTTKDLQDLLTQQLKPYVNEPQVTVILRDIRSRKVFLVGKVGRPGPYLLNGHKTALELIVEGGGLAQFAKGGSIYLIRNRDGRETRMHFNYKRALSGKDQKADIELLPGDMIVVP